MPGVGAVVGPPCIAAIEDPDRFAKSRSVDAILGMVAAVAQLAATR